MHSSKVTDALPSLDGHNVAIKKRKRMSCKYMGMVQQSLPTLSVEEGA